MTDLLLNPTHFSWLLLAGVIFIFEIFTLTMIFLWVGMAAVFVAAVKFFFPEIALVPQLIIFSISSMFAVFIWFKFFERKKQNNGEDTLNNRTNRYIGKLADLLSDSNGLLSKVKIEDSFWKVQLTEELPKGTKVRIIGSINNLLLKAEKYEP